MNKNKQDTGSVQVNKRIVSYIYKGTILVWEGLKSCFGGGYWNNEKPWDNNDIWKN